MTPTVNCIWVDDSPDRVKRAVGHDLFRRIVSVQVVTSCAAGEQLVRPGNPLDLVILDVSGGDQERICQRALRGPLAGFPWLLVSDLARNEKLAKADVIAMSRHFITLMETGPDSAARIVEDAFQELRNGIPGPARSYMQMLAHDARNKVDKVRLRAYEAALRQPSSDWSELETQFAHLEQILMTIALQ